LLMHADVKPIGRLSRSDVLEIRSVVTRSRAPHWSWFTRANLRSWPTFVRIRLTFRIVEIREDSIGSVTIHVNGTREEPGHPVTAWFKAYGWPTTTCRVERRNGRWMITPLASLKQGEGGVVVEALLQLLG
jgi:hypothetical protein